MKFGISTLLWGASVGQGDFDRLPAIREAGLQGTEVPVFDPANVPGASLWRAGADAGLERLRHIGVPVAVPPQSHEADAASRPRALR